VDHVDLILEYFDDICIACCLQDSSRLVFVSVKGPKSKRKVAVPISDETDWQSFVDTVRLKLKLSGVGDMHLASTGELVQSLDQLQDIDEVQVIEVRDGLACSISDMEWKKFTEIC